MWYFCVSEETIARDGRKNLATKRLYTIPTSTKTPPTFVNSNILNGISPSFSIKSLIIRFVDVPIRVKVPPKIAAYDNGSRTLVGLI
tara:strand:- start:540 stop:800 length:261 start_codon:yes stop_codon:yes gene_type:complete